jgi:hypothetical protein
VYSFYSQQYRHMLPSPQKEHGGRMCMEAYDGTFFSLFCGGGGGGRVILTCAVPVNK